MGGYICDAILQEAPADLTPGQMAILLTFGTMLFDKTKDKDNPQRTVLNNQHMTFAFSRRQFCKACHYRDEKYVGDQISKLVKRGLLEVRRSYRPGAMGTTYELMLGRNWDPKTLDSRHAKYFAGKPLSESDIDENKDSQTIGAGVMLPSVTETKAGETFPPEGGNFSPRQGGIFPPYPPEKFPPIININQQKNNLSTEGEREVSEKVMKVREAAAKAVGHGCAADRFSWLTFSDELADGYLAKIESLCKTMKGDNQPSRYRYIETSLKSFTPEVTYRDARPEASYDYKFAWTILLKGLNIGDDTPPEISALAEAFFAHFGTADDANAFAREYPKRKDIAELVAAKDWRRLADKMKEELS